MQQFCQYGSVRGAAGNRRPYRDNDYPPAMPNVDDAIPPRLLPARGPPLWEMPGAEPCDIDPQFQPAPDYEFDQRTAW